MTAASLRLSRRIDAIEPAVTLALDARAKALQRAGEDVVNMAVGEPDFPAPAIVREAAAARARSGDVRYTPVAGTPSLRAILAEHLAATRGGSWSAEQVVVCHSAKHALSGTLLVLLDEGDEVLVPVPAWSSYFDLVRLTGATPVLVPGVADDEGYRPDLDALRAAVTPRTRMVLINSPSNPTGAVWSADEVARVAELAEEHDLWLLSDEIYRGLVDRGVEAIGPAALGEPARGRTLIVDGASKGLAMTGYRIGHVAGPAEVVAAVAKLHGQTAGSPNTIAQHAWEAALREPPPELADMARSFEERRRAITRGLRGLGLPTPEPRGAFYAFPNVAEHLGEGGSVAFCEELLERRRLALVPGAAFGVDEHVRLSCAVAPEVLTEALARLGSFLAERRGSVR